MPVDISSLRAKNAGSLPRTTPEAEGVSSSAILEFLDGIEEKKLELHSLMLLRRGRVLVEGWWAPYAPQHPHMLYSLSKSFLSTAAGLAIAEGFFGLDDAVISFFPHDLPETISDNLATMQVRHLLSMSTGHAEDKTGILRSDPDGNWARAFLSQSVEYEPGTHFRYNSAATYMVSAILQRTTTSSALDFLRPRLLEPLGIKEAVWETDPQGIAVGGWGLSLRTEDIARFGEVYRCGGVWNEEPLVPADWVEAATRAQVSNGDQPESDWQQGYGYQFWRCRHGAFRADGAFGQFCVVLPKQQAVFVTTANVNDLQAVLDLLWETLMPSMTEVPAPFNVEAQERLRRRLTELQVSAPEGKLASPISDTVTGRTYRFPENEQGLKSVRVDFTRESVMLTVEDSSGSHSVTAGLGEWRNGLTTFLLNGIRRTLPTRETQGEDVTPVAAFAAWTAEDTLALRLCLVETPFTPTLFCTFIGNTRLRVAVQGRVGFGPPERPILEGSTD